MSASGSGAIGPVSVRYAAQIRELLFAQAMQRMAADQEAARAQSRAERATSVEREAKTEAAAQPATARSTMPEPVNPIETVAQTRSAAPTTPAQLVDVQA
jgi:hypothetical protein